MRRITITLTSLELVLEDDADEPPSSEPNGAELDETSGVLALLPRPIAKALPRAAYPLPMRKAVGR